MIHTDLPIYRTGVQLMQLAVQVQVQLPREVKRHLGQASHSHHDRARLANAVRDLGHSINGSFTKAYA